MNVLSYPFHSLLLRLCLGVYKGMKWNEMKWNDYKRIERNGMELNVFK